MKKLVKKSFQVNMHFGEKEMSACGALGLVFAPTLNKLVKKIQKKFDLKLEQIELTFQPKS